MNIIQRVKDILLTPKQTWPVIEAEASDIGGLYRSYIMILAAIPAVASFIGMTLIGLDGFGVSVRMPLLSGVAQMATGYVLSLVMVFVIALIVDALAPIFGGQKSQLNALKLVAYGSTAGMVGGIFGLIPALSMLGLLAALYSIYLIYLGLPNLMKCPQEKALPYTAVIVLCGILAGFVIGAASSLFTPGPAMEMGSPGFTPNAEVKIDTPEGQMTINADQVKEAAQRMEELGKQLEEAQKNGDQAAADQAMKKMQEQMANMGIRPEKE